MHAPVIRDARTVLTHRRILAHEPERVFPLLCPVLEYDWIPGWNGRIVHSRTGYGERGCVFTTDAPGFGPESWTTFRCEPCAAVGFVRASTHCTVLYEIALAPLSGGGCELTATQAFTPLTDAGADHVARLAAGDYERIMTRVTDLLDEYLHRTPQA
ncbi:MAG: hypothetical protein H0S85_15775 [Desulfovibrionaceae bacterium]|jgi:hypothetical protein|nr:hypothetical protein [Desulfovibrionaceae bacterium]